MKITKRAPTETARNYTTRIIIENIVSATLKPGSIVSEKELSLQLGVSRTPVRETFLELSNVGIVEILPQIGTRISYINPEDVEESRFIRHILEKGIIESLCKTGLTLDQEKVLRENLELQEFYLNYPQENRGFILDNEFHKLLFDFAGYSRAYNLNKNLNIHFDRVRKLGDSDHILHNSQILIDHKMIFEYILKKDSENASKLISTHLSRCTLNLQKIKAEFPSYFSDFNKI